MPYFRRRRFARKRFVRKKFARKRYGRKRSNPTTTMNGSVGPFPNRYMTKLKYNDIITAGGVNIDQIFNLNSIYDPDRTGTGHQPYGHDWLSVVYNRYRVYKVTWYIDASITTGSGQVTVLPINDTNVFTSATLAAETPRAIHKLVQYGVPCRFSGSAYLPKLNGSTSAAYKSDDRFQAQFGASPSELLGLHVVSSTLAGAATNTISYDVTLNYYVELFDPITQAQS